MKAASLCLISPVRGSSLAASNLSMKHFILVPQRPSKSVKYFYTFYIFSSSIFFKFSCSIPGFELEVVHLGFNGTALQCTLMVVFSRKLSPLTFSRANTLLGGRCFMAGLPTGRGHSQCWVQPLSLLELESCSLWLSRAVTDLTQGRHSGGKSELGWVIQVLGWVRCKRLLHPVETPNSVSVSLLPGEYCNQQVSDYSELTCSFIDIL